MTIAYSQPNILILLKVLPPYVTMVTELATYLSEISIGYLIRKYLYLIRNDSDITRQLNLYII